MSKLIYCILHCACELVYEMLEERETNSKPRPLHWVLDVLNNLGLSYPSKKDGLIVQHPLPS